MRVLIAGCGYVGVALGADLVRRGHEVFGLRRSNAAQAQLNSAGVKSLVGDICRSDNLAELPAPFDWVVNCVSSGGGGLDEYRACYLQGTQNLLSWLEPRAPRKFVYTSSTGVYGQTDGAAVKEDSPTEPASPTAQVLVETEQVLRAAFAASKFPAVILRLSGIYGPDRIHFLRQVLARQAKIAGQGDRIMNMVHRDDVVGAVVAALQQGRPGEIYNVTDDEPVTQLHFYRWLAEALGRPLPPFSTEAEVEERKRGLANKKVRNRKLKMELGYQLKYPTFREGYTDEIARLQQAGLLE